MITPPAAGTVEGVDWARIRDRLRKAIEATEHLNYTSTERTQAILEARASKLARICEPEDPGEHLVVTLLTLGTEQLALETRFVREVFRRRECTPVPRAVEALVGITNVRGELLPVFDLARLLGISSAEPGWILVLGTERSEFGILADEVREVISLRVRDLHPPPDSPGEGSAQLARGLTSEAVLVLNGAALLADERLYMTGR